MDKRLFSLAASALVVLVWQAGGSAPAHADERGFEYGEIDDIFEEPQVRKGHVDLGVIDQFTESYFRNKKDLHDRTGFTYLVEDRLINQWGDNADIYDNELNLIGRWDVLKSDVFGSGSINVWGQFAQSIGDTAGQFQAKLGILSPLNGGNGGPARTNEILQMLNWEQIGPNEKFRFQVGKLATRTLVNLNRYAHGDSESFFTPMLGNNPVVPYTALLGLGIFAQWKETGWYISGLVRAPDTELGISFDALGKGYLEYIVELALTPTIAGLGFGEYRVTVSHNEASPTLPEVSTVSLSIDQDIGDQVGAFFRFAYGEKTFRAFKTRVNGGFILKQPFGYEFDRLGVGAWWGKPTDKALNDEIGLEVFYVAQITPVVEVTPNVQLVFDPALSGEDVEAIVGLRTRAAF